MKNQRRRILSILMGLVLSLQLCSVMPATAAESRTEKTDTTGAEKVLSPEDIGEDAADAVAGEVIVRYRAGALAKSTGNAKMLKMVRRRSNVSSSFGASEKAVKSESSVASTVDSQTSILSGLKDFVIEDTIDFRDVIKGADAPVYSRISSDRYTTEELIKLLEANPDIESVTPNYILEPESLPDYELNDTYASSLLHLNSAAAVNKNGPQAYNRGYESEIIPSLNASVAWERSDKLASASPKPVVAVVDTGVDTTHEDLQGSMWTNPGNIGLRGDHGYNFMEDKDTLIDDHGHGTHCAGVIAAQKNNETGTAGVASGLVEIMGLRILGTNGSAAGGVNMAFNVFAAFQYVLKAKKNGVNITVCSNSWGANPNVYQNFDELFDALGEAGVLVMFAAGNESTDIDTGSESPGNCYSDYLLTVGAIKEDGTPAGFSNYGNANVDLFAPGNNILSTVSYTSYSPYIYSPERMTKTTSYYGEFSSNMTSGDSAPVLGDDGNADYTGVGQFGKPIVVTPNGVTHSLTIEPSHAVNPSKNPACLKFTLRGLTPGSDCWIYFPYTKSRYDDGSSYDFSLGFIPHVTDPAYNGEAATSEIIRKKDGSFIVYNEDKITTNIISVSRNGIERHKNGKTAPYSKVDRDDVDSYGIGMRIRTKAVGTTDEVSFYINHVAVSKESVTKYYGKYDTMSGTSMACPAAAGTAALLACLEPAGSEAAGGATGGKYVKYLKNRMFGMTKHSEALEGKCQTEGYLDFTCLDSKQPVISDVLVNADKGTIKLIGKNLKSTGDSQISYKRIYAEDSSYKDVSANATWAGDGTSVTIQKAGSLIGTYTRFKITHNGGSGVGAFFLVKGEKALKKVAENPVSSDVFLVTDANRKRVFCIDGAGDLSEMKAKKGFVGVKMKESNRFIERLKAAILENFTSTETLLYNEGVVKFDLRAAVTVGNTIRLFANVTGRAEKQMFMGTLDLNKKTLNWKVTPVNGLKDFYTAFVIGKTIYAAPINYSVNTADELDKNIYYLKNGIWKPTGATIPENITCSVIGTYKNAAYFMGNTVLVEDESGVKREDSSSIYKFTGKAFTKMKAEFPKPIRHLAVGEGKTLLEMTLAETSKGLMGSGISLDGYGNTFLYDPKKDTFTAIPVTAEPGISSEEMGLVSAATTNAFYVVRRYQNEEVSMGYEIYQYMLR